MKSLKAFLKQKTGMTFVEILVAMSVLMLVIVSFTPMLLHSYDSLYTAGEINEKTYDTKSTVEEGLAARSSTDILYNIQTNFKNIGKVTDVNLRRAVSATGSDLRDGIESLFYGGKATVKIISGKRVNDDTVDKTILIKTSGIVIDKVVAGKDSDAKMTKNGKEFKYTIAVSVIAPDWSKTTETQAYDQTPPLTDITCSGPDDKGMITVTIPDKDLTSSPLKIIVYYYDETTKLNNIGTEPASGEKPREAATFLYIDPPTLLLAGKTESNGVYYTSAGIETANNGVSTMKVEKRNMTAAGNFSVPGLGSTVIKNVTWVDNDPTSDYGNYYVLTGTNGAIMRLYPSLTNGGFTNIQGLTATTSTKKPVSIKDSGLTKTVYPTLWGGDYSHEYRFSSYYHGIGYAVQEDGKDDNGWITEGNADVYGTQAKYSYYYNGNNTEFFFRFQNGRNISYILTEYGEPTRFFGCKADKKGKDFVNYTSLWGKNNLDSIYKNQGNWLRSNSEMKPFYYRTKDDNDDGDFRESDFSQLRIKALQSFDSTTYLFEDLGKDAAEDYNNATKSYNRYSSVAAPTDLTVTDAVYLPELGKMFYVGTKSAYVYFRSQDPSATTNTRYYALKDIDNLTVGHGTKVRKANIPKTYFTGYYIAGKSTAEAGSVIRKYYSANTDFDALTNSLKAISGINNTTGTMTANSAQANAFFVNRASGSYYFSDVNFTLGYASDRMSVFANITYDGNVEYYKSYEPYYFLSHYGATIKDVDVEVSDKTIKGKESSHEATFTPSNSYNNDFYNVWFPGECYNMTKVATKEGVTVGVGYAVSGSTYQNIIPRAAGTYNSFSWDDISHPGALKSKDVKVTIGDNQVFNTSTGLGGIYNDGIMAVSINGGSFKNILYFKDNGTMNADYLTNQNTSYKSAYQNAFGTYGTHARNSIQFTAVDLQVLATRGKDDTADTKTYYAYYGDNTGRVFKSKIATATATGSEDDSSTSTVDFIADLSYAGSTTPPSRMEEITLNGASLSTYFKSINTIVCDDTTVIISGVPRSSTYGNSVVVGVAVVTQTQDTETTTWKWGHVELASSYYLTNVAKIVDGNYYAAGTYNTSKGFLLGIPLETIKEAVQKGTVDLRSKVLVDNTHITTPIYGMDGRGANG